MSSINGNGASVLEELRGLARRVEEAQKLRGWSAGEVCRRYAGLGSTKTYKRILDLEDDLSEGLKLERQLENYREALALIEMASADDAPEELVFEDFVDVVRVVDAVKRAHRERGNSRLVIVEGENGSGKTTICQLLEARWPNVLVRTEATEVWKDSPMAMLRALLLGVGKREARKKEVDGKSAVEVNMPQCADERMSKLVDQLNEQVLIVAVDEAHHLGARTLNLIKSLINQTPSVFVLLAIPTLLRRVQTKAYEEARQLTQNRLQQRVVLRDVGADEALEMLKRRGVTWSDRKVGNDCGLKLAERAAVKGHWKFVVMVARKLRLRKQPVDEKGFIEALLAVERER